MNEFRFERWIGVNGVPVQCFSGRGSFSGNAVALLSKDQSDGHTRWSAVFGTTLRCWRSIEVALQASVVMFRVTKIVSHQATPDMTPDMNLLRRRLSEMAQPMQRHVRLFERSYIYSPEGPMMFASAKRTSRPENSFAHLQAALLSRLQVTPWQTVEYKHIVLRLRQAQENLRVCEKFRIVPSCEMHCVSDDPITPPSAGNSQRRHSFLIQTAENSNFSTTPDRTA